MEVSEKIQKIKILLGMETPAPVVAEFVDVKTSDGVVLRIDGKTPTVGAKCMVIDANGETPATDGSYTLEDGTGITVQGGAIAEVSSAKEEATETEQPAKMEETLSEATQGQVKSITYKYADEKLAEFKTASDLEIAELKKQIEVLSNINKEMFALVEKVAGIPAAEPTQAPKEIKKSSFLKSLRDEVKESKENLKKFRFEELKK